VIVAYADRPDLLERRGKLAEGFPEFLHHNAVGTRFWGSLYTRFPDYQLCFYDEARDELVAEAHSIPIPWDGSLDDLPRGWDDAFERGALSERPPGALCALAISVDERRRGERLSYRMIDALRDAARNAGLGSLVAPVRPSWKDRYPLIPIERYAQWRRSDGSHFDPWVRAHERVGGEILCVAPESLVMEAPVADWATWTGLAFPDDGDYVIPGALAPVRVKEGIGRHVEPNIWVLHRL
jgi:GNAT superfamily N-acetyltransferase